MCLHRHMPYLFVDESGDLGFNWNGPGPSRFFVVAALICAHKRPIEKLVKKIHRGLAKKYRMEKNVLHAAELRSIDVIRFCKQLVDKDAQIVIAYVEKQKVKPTPKNKHDFYIACIRMLLRACLIQPKPDTLVFASRRETNKALNNRFKRDVESTMKSSGVQLSLNISNPYEEKSLQAADIVSWAMFQYFEYGDKRYFSILKPLLSKVVEIQ